MHLTRLTLFAEITNAAKAAGAYNRGMALAPAEARRWLEQWTSAGPALAEFRKRSLRELTESQALAASEAVLSLATLSPVSPRRRTHSGLVTQQALFHRHRLRT